MLEIQGNVRHGFSSQGFIILIEKDRISIGKKKYFFQHGEAYEKTHVAVSLSIHLPGIARLILQKRFCCHYPPA